MKRWFIMLAVAVAMPLLTAASCSDVTGAITGATVTPQVAQALVNAYHITEGLGQDTSPPAISSSARRRRAIATLSKKCSLPCASTDRTATPCSSYCAITKAARSLSSTIIRWSRLTTHLSSTSLTLG